MKVKIKNTEAGLSVMGVLRCFGIIGNISEDEKGVISAKDPARANQNDIIVGLNRIPGVTEVKMEDDK